MSLSFIEKAVKIHKDRYDYSLVDYKNSRTKVKIICKEHGVFEQQPRHHTGQKSGCLICGGKRKLSTQEFIERSMKIHGDRYDYSLVDYYKNNKTKIKIICKVHGVFEQSPKNHLDGCGCIRCIIKPNTSTSHEFVEKAKKVHGELYDYSLVDYKNSYTHVKILCKEHGVFEQQPRHHFEGSGCSKCTSKSYSKLAMKWLESLGISNLRTALSQEGEFTIPGSLYKADGYCEETNTIYEFHGDYWHGNPKVFDPNEINVVNKKTFGELYENTLRKKEYILSLGFKYVEMWESDYVSKISTCSFASR